MAVVTMPKATMDEDDGMIFREHDIRFSGEFPDVQPEPEAMTMQQASHQEFRFRVPPLNAGHHPASGCSIHYVCHWIQANSTDGWTIPGCSFSIMASTWGSMMRATSRMTGTTTLFPNWR